MPRPSTLSIDTHLYDLTHLAPFIINDVKTLHRQDGVPIICVFTCHCFTVACHDMNCSYPHEEENRDFCPSRHEASLDLPGLIRNALSIAQSFKAYESQDRNGAVNYLIVDDPHSHEKYFIYFKVDRAKPTDPVELKLTVSSAYRKAEGLPQKTIKIGTLIDMKLGLQPRSSKKRRRKK